MIVWRVIGMAWAGKWRTHGVAEVSRGWPVWIMSMLAEIPVGQRGRTLTLKSGANWQANPLYI